MSRWRSPFRSRRESSRPTAPSSRLSRRRARGNPQLYVRRLNQLQATPLAGTDDADESVLFAGRPVDRVFRRRQAEEDLRHGRRRRHIVRRAERRGGAWSEDGTIVFTPGPPLGVGLMRVSSAGGTPEPLTSLAEGEVTQRWPQVLPGGKAVLFTSSRDHRHYDDATLVVQPLPTGPRKVVLRGGSHGRYLPSGHLVYIHDGTLFAVPFDLDRLEVTGQPVPALEGVMSNATIGKRAVCRVGQRHVGVSAGAEHCSGVPIHWMDREGKTTPLRATPANWSNLLFSPDGRRLAWQIVEGQSDIWVYEWARDTLTRLTSDPANDTKPVWTPDGRRIVFASARADTSTLICIGSGPMGQATPSA